MMEALYKEFTDSGRELTWPEFSFKYKQAKALIDYLTFARIDYSNIELLERFNNCVLEMIYLEYDKEKYFEGNYRTDGMKSESVGSHRVDYVTATVETIQDQKKLLENEFYRIVKKYFGSTGLMYRGF